MSDGLLGFPVKYLQLRIPGARVMTRRNLRGLLPALLIAGSTTGSASGQQDFVNYPTEVRRALVAADESCRRAGGTRVTLTLNAIRKLDLNGDGRDDYIVDFHETECGGRASFFCGTGGCDLLILVAQRGGALRKIFDDRVRGYEILSGRGPSEIRLTFMNRSPHCACPATATAPLPALNALAMDRRPAVPSYWNIFS